jgi:hypothetical protein
MMTESRRLWSQWILPSVAVAAFLFVLNHAAVISGALAPPPGYVPQYVLRNTDMTVYLNSMQAGRHVWLPPNFSAPWLTPNELFTPILTLLGHMSNFMPWSVLVDYYVLHFLATVGATILLIAALRYFLPSGRQRLAAIAVIFCSVPFLSIWYAVARAAGASPGLSSLGLIEYTYTTADGLVRGGASNSITLTFGTAVVLAAVLLLAKRIETGGTGWLWAAAGANLASAFFHPFEFAVITGTGCLLFGLEGFRTRDWRRAVRHSLVLVAAGVLGLSPYLIQLSRVGWLRDMSSADPAMPMNIGSVLLMWGMPAFLTVYAPLMRFRPRTPKDEVLAAWCLVAVLLLFAHPPSPFHLLDGFTYINAMLLVRIGASDPKARTLLERNRRPLAACCCVWFLLCAGAQAATLIQLVRDGRSADPDVLISTVAPESEQALRQWLRGHATPDDVVLAPGLMSAWLTTIPMHGFAAQDNFSISYEHQSKQSASFYAGEWSGEHANEFLHRYGIRWVVVPLKSSAKHYLEERAPAALFGDLALYRLPENHTREYPGRAEVEVVALFPK